MASRVPLYTRAGLVAHAVVDDVDFPRVSEYRWNLHPSGHASKVRVAYKGVWQHLKMHRFVLWLPDGDPRHAHHINGDKLDNRRSNLVAIDPSEHQRLHRRLQRSLA